MAQISSLNVDMMAGDTGTTLTLTINENGTLTPYNLTGCTVSLQWLNQQNVLVSKPMTITDATNGVCAYTFASEDTFPGTMTFQAVVTNTATGQYLTTSQRFLMNVGSPL